MLIQTNFAGKKLEIDIISSGLEFLFLKKWGLISKEEWRIIVIKKQGP